MQTCLIAIQSINIMSERLSKLAEYLEEGYYEMAITTYAEHPEELSDSHALELARAYVVFEDYNKAIDLTDKLASSSAPNIYYEAKLLQIKAKHLLGIDSRPFLTEMINKCKYSPIYKPHHIHFLQEVNQVLMKHHNNLENLKRQNRESLKKQGKYFFDTLQKEQIENPLNDGFPMFLISEVWFGKWKNFIKANSDDECPGAITNFEILDHRFDSLWDPLPHKKYTNYQIYPSSRVKVLPKSCWNILRDIYAGIEIKRFNVWVSGKPREIMTQIHLRKIKVAREGHERAFELCFSKKENWGNVSKKLRGIWGEGFLYRKTGEEFKPLNAAQVLEQVDTCSQLYVYSSVKKEKPVAKVTQSCPVCKSTTNLKYCQCKSVKYCSMNCLKEDREKHRKKCELELAHYKQQSAIAENFELAEKAYGGRKGLVGLKNIGNTCYMNSGLQCMSNTKQITDYFMSNKFLNEINKDNKLGTKGYLSCAYAELIRNMWTGTESSISPYTLKKVIGKFAGQFSGYAQQDSQQLISYLIDGLQEDLNLVKKKETFETNDEILPDEEASKLSEINHAKRIRSYIRDLMAGQFKSTVICSLCNRLSVCFDPYLLISLPLPTSRENELYFIPYDSSMSALRIMFSYGADTSVGSMREEISRKYLRERNDYLEFLEVSLETMEVLNDKVDDNEMIGDLIARVEREKTSLLVYEGRPLKKGEVRFKINYYYGKEKIGYPRFINIPSIAKPEEIGEILWPSVQRFSKTSSRSFSLNTCLNTYATLPSITEDKVISVSLCDKLSMLKCKTDEYRIRLNSKSLNLNQCLSNFTLKEVLEGKNEWYCNKCKKFVVASKQMEVYKSNKILVLAFKRFSRGWKIKNFIDFPIEGLDMGPYIKSNTSNKKILYDLYGVVNHYGTMGGGHYTAYCKNFLNNRWYEFDDSRVCEIKPRDAVTDNAYVLFYRMRD